MRSKEVDILLLNEVGESVGSCLKVKKSSLFSLIYPSAVVAVAVEDYVLMFNDYSLYEIM